jgi:hypothetical protein
MGEMTGQPTFRFGDGVEGHFKKGLNGAILKAEGLFRHRDANKAGVRLCQRNLNGSRTFHDAPFLSSQSSQFVTRATPPSLRTDFQLNPIIAENG